MWKTKFITSRTARASAQSAAGAIAVSPSAPAPSCENSQASLAAVAELAGELHFVFDHFNYDNEPGDLLQLHLERLSDEASKYRNSRVGDAMGKEWTFSYETGQLLYAACQCSSMVYKPVSESGPELIPVISRTPSMTGTTKAMSIWKLPRSNALIVSIRGTASAADHMVNLNARPKDASSVFRFAGESPVYAHGGFLVCAKALLPSLSEELARQLGADSTISQVIFTGHSAGGAVSSLIFLHFASNQPHYLSGIKLSLVTFGSAPVTSSSVTELVSRLPCVDMVVSFVNEYDMVTRADHQYLRSVVNLYRSGYGLPSAAGDATATRSSRPLEKKYALEIPGLETSNDTDSRLAWTLPLPVYRLVGDIVVLKSSLNISPVMRDTASDTSTIAGTSLKAVQLTPREFGELLFCDVGVHKRKIYLERMRTLTMAIPTAPPSFTSDDDTIAAELDDIARGGIGLAISF